MAAKPYRWTPETIERAIGILRGHEDIRTALDALSRAFGREVSRMSIDMALRKAGRDTASSYLRVPAYTPARSIAVEEIPVVLDDAWDDQTDPDIRIETPTATEERPSETRAEIDAHRLRRQNADLDAARKRLVAELADKEEQIAILRELRDAHPLPPIVERPAVGALQRQGIPVLVCSDWHVEEPVDPKKVNGLNEYSLDIADRCIDRLVDAFEWLLRDVRYDCREAIVALLGDLLSGYIHAELEEGNFLSPTEAILWLSERIERMLRRIAARCPELARIIVVCCDGNHGRNTHKIRVSTRTSNSLEWLLYHTLAAKMADDPRFEFRIADGEWIFVDIYEQTIAFTHGDSFQYGGGVGGISIPIRRGIARQFQGRKIAKYCMGHFHQQQDFGDILINGSMIGYSPYAMRVHAPFEPRKQSWFLWDSRNGQALSAPVWL